VLAVRLAGFQVPCSAEEGKKGGEWAWQLLSTLWHGGECTAFVSDHCRVCRSCETDTVRRAAARPFGRDAQSAMRLPESRSWWPCSYLAMSRPQPGCLPVTSSPPDSGLTR